MFIDPLTDPAHLRFRDAGGDTAGLGLDQPGGAVSAAGKETALPQPIAVAIAVG